MDNPRFQEPNNVLRLMTGESPFHFPPWTPGPTRLHYVPSVHLPGPGGTVSLS